MIDGSTVHGTQLIQHGAKAVSNTGPTVSHYYQSDTGVSLAFDFVQQSPSSNIGVVGLGAGVLASLGREQDSMTFYEINPAVISLAYSHFDYLQHSAASLQVIQGDARVNLQQELSDKSHQFDLLVIDAFSSDAIPAHLLTREAFSLYWKHLKPDGVLAIHISNTYLDLSKVIEQHAGEASLLAARTQVPGSHASFGSDWMLIAKADIVAQLQQRGSLHGVSLPVKQSTSPDTFVWSDSHHSIFHLLKAG